jgi:prepilin-type N-terminal cleavage/methylation domain-containing protein
MKVFKKTSKGFTLVEIMIVVAIIGILIAIAVPGFVRAREQSRNRACQENLTKIDGAKEQFALESNAAAGAACALTDLVGADLYLKRDPICPSGGDYTVGNIGTDPTCSTGGEHALTAIGAPVAP